MQLRYLNIFFSLSFIVISVLLFKSTEGVVTYAISTTSIYVKFLAISMFICSFFELVKSIIKKDDTKVLIAENVKKFSILIVLLVIYVISMRYLGFVISSMIFLVLTMWFMGYHKIIRILITSVLIVAFVYILFSWVFKIPLPEAVIFEGLL